MTYIKEETISKYGQNSQTHYIYKDPYAHCSQLQRIHEEMDIIIMARKEGRGLLGDRGLNFDELLPHLVSE